MRVRTVVSLLALVLILCLFSGCSGDKAKSIKAFRPIPSTFSLELFTSEMVDAMGYLDVKLVNANVVPAREAIRILEGKGYKYEPNGGR